MWFMGMSWVVSSISGNVMSGYQSTLLLPHYYLLPVTCYLLRLRLRLVEHVFLRLVEIYDFIYALYTSVTSESGQLVRRLC